jgi:hypothetical protein
MSTQGDDTGALFETLQTEVGEWSTENFADQPDVNPLLGTGEEAGNWRRRSTATRPPTRRS